MRIPLFIIAIIAIAPPPTIAWFMYQYFSDSIAGLWGFIGGLLLLFTIGGLVHITVVGLLVRPRTVLRPFHKTWQTRMVALAFITHCATITVSLIGLFYFV